VLEDDKTPAAGCTSKEPPEGKQISGVKGIKNEEFMKFAAAFFFLHNFV
jgi:hypothetical protein